MILNYIWVSFFIIAFVVALVRLLFFMDMDIFPAMLQSTFDMAKTGFEISLALTGIMSLWLGIMKIGEKGGIVPILSKAVGPFFTRLFPEVPKDHPATGSIIMNFSANILGLDNAATPLGLKAMKELQEINPDKDTASNAQIMFLVLNASGLTIIPISVIADRATLGAMHPTSIFLPTMIATFCSTLAGLAYVSFKQKVKLLDGVLLSYLFGATAVVGLGVWYFAQLTPEQLQVQSSLFTSVAILTVIISFFVLGLIRKINLFESFIEGAKEGFSISIKIIPFLVAILVGIGLFRTSGALNYVKSGIAWSLEGTGVDTEFVEALPVAFLKPLSGQAARGMMIDISKNTPGGPDSFVANLAAIFRGCAETTFYILALYFGSVSIRNTRYALSGGLIADAAGVVAGILVGYLFFH